MVEFRPLVLVGDSITDGWTEAITISSSLFILKSVGIITADMLSGHYLTIGGIFQIF